MKNTNKKSKLTLYLAAFFIFAGGFTLGNLQANGAMPWLLYSSKEPENVDLSPMWRVWNVIDEKYVPTRTEKDKLEDAVHKNGFDDLQERVWGAAMGIAASLGDPYTMFLPPQDNKLFEEDISGSFEGVGMEIAVRDGILTVVSPLKGTPAYKAGVKPGDKIIEIDGKSTEGININDAVKVIRGPKGSKVTFKIIREGESDPIEISVIRDKIEIPVIETSSPKKGVFVIELMSFTEDSPARFANAMAEFIKSKSDTLILDLRGNPGGYLDAAVDIASWFLPKGALVVSEDFGDKRPQLKHRSSGIYYGPLANKKVIVLIDKGSASASEILAGALRAHKRATLIGENSFGKGSVQELVPITKDTSLKVTVARFLLPNGEWIMEKGIKPDIEVKKQEKNKCEANEDKDDKDKDLIMEKALEFISKSK